MINAEQILLLVSFSIILAYVAGIFYHRTKVPDIVWLLGFGMLLGPALHLVDESLYASMFDLVLLVIFTMFSFSTGISIDAQQLLGYTGKALGLAVACFLAITVAVGVSLNAVLPGVFSLLDGLLLGSIVGSAGGVSVSSLLSSIREGFGEMGDAGVLLQLESAIGDPIRVVGVLTLIRVIDLTGVGPLDAVRDVLRLLAASAATGLCFGLAWGELLSRLRDRPLNYMMTIGALFAVYVFAEWLGGGGGGPIAVLLVGAVLMNYGYVTRRMGWARRARIDRRKLRDYHDELTFLMKALFFVYLGLIMVPTSTSLEISLFVSLLIVVVRFLVVTVVGRALRLGDEELYITRMIFIQGASTLVLSQFPSRYDPEGLFFANPDIFTTLCVPVVLFSILYNSIVSPVLARRHTEVGAGDARVAKPEGGEKATE